MKGKCYEDDEKLKKAVRKRLQNQEEELYRRGVLDLSEKWATAITRQGELIGDYHCFGNIFIFKMMCLNHI